MPTYRYRNEGDTEPREIVGDRITPHLASGLLAVEGERTAGIDPDTLEVRDAKGQWRTLGDAFRKGDGPSDDAVLSVAWKAIDNLCRVAEGSFRSWNLEPDSKPIPVRFRSTNAEGTTVSIMRGTACNPNNTVERETRDRDGIYHKKR